MLSNKCFPDEILEVGKILLNQKKTFPTSFSTSPFLLICLYFLSIIPSKAFNAIRMNKPMGNANKSRLQKLEYQKHKPTNNDKILADIVIWLAEMFLECRKISMGFSIF